MTDHQSDAELHMERLVQIAVDPKPRDTWALRQDDAYLVFVGRRYYANLMLSLAVRLEAGRAPGTR